VKRKTILVIFSVFTVVGLFSGTTFAAPYGAGKYDANVPYGGQTALSIATDGNVTIPISASNSGTLATGMSTVTVTSSDVVGYKLYLRALGATTMTNGSSTLAASANATPAPLAVDTWGYNTDASSNFVGPALTDTLIKSVTGPVTSGSVTTFTYGVKIDFAKSAGAYTGTILYTAVPQTN
jgi:hypothetical protein